MVEPFTEMVMSRFGGENQDLGNVKFDMSISNTRGDIEQEVRQMNLEFRGDVLTGDVNLGVTV